MPEVLDPKGVETVSVADRLLILVEGREPAISFTMDVSPISKARARVVQTRRGTRSFTPLATRSAEEHLSWMWRLALKGRKYTGNLAIACVFYRPDRRRIDGDNMIKLVLDAGTKAGAWHDDCQLTTQLIRIELDADHPRTEVALCASASTLGR